jgi:hypothetical protein
MPQGEAVTGPIFVAFCGLVSFNLTKQARTGQTT